MRVQLSLNRSEIDPSPLPPDPKGFPRAGQIRRNTKPIEVVVVAVSPGAEIIEKIKKTEYAPLAGILEKRDSAAQLLKELPARLSPEKIREPSKEQQVWEWCGLYYLNTRRFHEAVDTFEALYYAMLQSQEAAGQRTHKGMPLVWMFEADMALRRTVVAKRLLMLTLIEDAIRDKGNIIPTEGVYFRLVWRFGLTDAAAKSYGQRAYELSGQRIVIAVSEVTICMQIARAINTSNTVSGGVLVLHGYGIRVVVDRGHLVVADGICEDRRLKLPRFRGESIVRMSLSPPHLPWCSCFFLLRSRVPSSACDR
jgi:hypothetical protein